MKILVFTFSFFVLSVCMANAQSAFSPGAWAVVQVKAALLWRTPRPGIQLRDAQFPFLSTRDLTLAERLALGDSETQLLFGEKVRILSEQDSWVQVQVSSQPKRGFQNGYTAWIQKKWLALNAQYLSNFDHAKKAVVTVAESNLWADAEHTKKLSVLSYGTELPVLKLGDGWVVSVPTGGQGYLSHESMNWVDPSVFSVEKLLAQAKLFIGVRYVWGGTSAEGFDCSGFAYRLFHSQGVIIPRNADDQANEGAAVSTDQVRAGDLVFFAMKGVSVGVDHVGIYLGDGKFIHSPDARSAVQMSNLSAPFWQKRWVTTRRYGS